MGVCALAVTVGAATPSFAADDSDDDDAGRLRLDSAVLVDGSVGTGSAGEFAIRGELFSSGLTERVQGQSELSAQRLRVVDTLDFSPETSTSADADHRRVRATLFADYSPHGVTLTAQEAPEEYPFLAVAGVVSVPVVLVAGVLIGRFWVRRRAMAA